MSVRHCNWSVTLCPRLWDPSLCLCQGLASHRLLPASDWARILRQTYSWDIWTPLMLTFALSLLQLCLVCTHSRMLLSTLPSFFPSLGVRWAPVVWRLSLLFRPRLFSLMSVFHNKNLAYLIPSWHLLLRGPGLTQLYTSKITWIPNTRVRRPSLW